MLEKTLSRRLLAWYRDQARDLPWRKYKDPYAIWVSEVMLQQTRVATAIPYFKRWMERFPSVHAVAKASEDAVLKEWEGLGYYRRARYLHQAAKTLVETNQGNLPGNVEALQSLPGIGPYTAAAIASIAFEQDVPAIDGNVRRVYSRVFNVDLPLSTSEGIKRIQTLAGEQLPSGEAGDFNQALMDLGASICTPQSPDCPRCPLRKGCQAYDHKIQEQRPVYKEKAPIPHHTVTAAVIQKNGSLLLAKRPPEALLGGMWEFPGGKMGEDETLEECLEREIKEELGIHIDIQEKVGVYQHAYTHYRITLHAFLCTLRTSDIQLTFHSSWTWSPLSELEEYPMGKLDRLISRKMQADYTPGADHL